MMLSENLSPRKGARGVKRVASASQMADFPGMAPTGPDLAVPARPRSLPVKMMAALVLCIVFFISATVSQLSHCLFVGRSRTL